MCNPYIDVVAKTKRIHCGLISDPPPGQPKVRTYLAYYNPEDNVWFRTDADRATGRENGSRTSSK